MTNKTIGRNYEDPVDDATEADVPEEFRYTPGRFKPISRDRFPLATAADIHPCNSLVREKSERVSERQRKQA